MRPDTQLEYWKQQLNNITPLELPLDHPRPPAYLFCGAMLRHEFPRDLSIALRALSAREQVSLFITLLASFNVLFYSYSQQEDILVGITAPQSTNLLAARTRLAGESTFRALLQHVYHVCQQAYAHQDIPFAELVSALRPEYHPDQIPFVLVAFTQTDLSTTASFDLSVRIIDNGLSLSSVIEYNAELFEQATIQRLIAHWQILLTGITTAPDSAIGSLPLVPNGKIERHALPNPAQKHADQATPRTEIEEQLVALWRSVLGVKHVGIHDNFFELGGHSLRAISLISHVRELFDIELPLTFLFEKPTIAEMARTIERTGKKRQTKVLEVVAYKSSLEIAPLSSSQMSFWLLEQLLPENISQIVTHVQYLRGHLSISAIERSINTVVQRHEILRTTFQGIDGQPMQVAVPNLHIPLHVVDLRAVATGEHDPLIQQLVSAETTLPFSLSQGPLLRTLLLWTVEEEYALVLIFHRIVMDQQSLDIFVDEMSALYTAFCHNHTPALPELPAQYSDYAIWQQQRLQGEYLETLIDYWTRRLAGAPFLIELPLSQPRHHQATSQGGFQTISFSRDVSRAIEQMAQQAGVTPFMFMLTAFEILLWRYTRQQDFLIGIPFIGRSHVQFEALIGTFVNTLVIRANVSGNMTARNLLQEVRACIIDAYSHQDLPLEQLIQKLKPPRMLALQPLYQTLFSWQNTPGKTLELPSIQSFILPAQTAMEPFDLALELVSMPTGITGSLKYNADLFDASFVVQIAEYLLKVVHEMVADLDQHISAFSFIGAFEREQMLQIWGQGPVLAYPETSISELFQQQEQKTPDAIALVWGDEQITYRAIYKQVRHLASILRKKGITTEVRVGFCLPTSPEAFYALLAILLAGGVYVPLDPNHPQDRLLSQCTDARVRAILSTRVVAQEHSWLSTSQIPLILLDEEMLSEPQDDQEERYVACAPNQAAYIIFTSGSTGKPKGVIIEHRSPLNLLQALEYDIYRVLRQNIQFSPAPFWVGLNAPLFFDASVQQWLTMLSGSRLILLPPSLRTDGPGLLDFIRTQAIQVLDGTPGHIELLSGYGLLQGAVSALLIAGEALPRDLWEELTQAPDVCTWNIYGPTECTVDATATCLPAPEAFPHARSAPLGKPLANYQLYVLDDWLQPVPLETVGEIYLGGSGVARGYEGQPDRTAEYFLPHPYSQRPGERLYKTGDMARYLPDGHLEFMGRKDQQVKIRGFRIELGEIEAALNSHAAVRESVVLAREDHPGEKRLVAYLVLAPLAESEKKTPSQPQLVYTEYAGRTLNKETVTEVVQQVQAHLQQHLPDYMQPASFLVLDTLPLNAQGKLDRHVLPAPQSAMQSNVYVAPRTQIEQTLVEIWCKLLHLERVGILDNFFHLGGHSLLVTQVISRVREVFHIELPVQLLFEAPTIAEFSKHITDKQSYLSRSFLATIPRAERDDAIPLSYAQQRLWFLNQLAPGSNSYNSPVVVRLSGNVNLLAFARSLRLLIQRHETLRTTFALRHGQPVQIIAPTSQADLTLIDLQNVPAASQQSLVVNLVEREVGQPFNLAKGPLLRVKLLCLNSTEYILIIVMHHIITDARSLEILVRDLILLNQSVLLKTTFPLLPLPIQYADYAYWQNKWFQGQVLHDQLRYWKLYLAEAPTILWLPTDYPRPPRQSFRGDKIPFQVPPDLYLKLLRLCHQENMTPFMLLLAAFQMLLWCTTQQSDFLIGIPIANRTRVETEQIIGFFVNTLVLRAALQGNPEICTVLRNVREAALGAYAHQDLPFDRLVQEMNPHRDLSRNPLFQVMFTYEKTTQQTMEFPGLSIRPFEMTDTTVIFDLVLSMEDENGQFIGTLVYNSDLFKRETILRMVTYFQLILEHLPQDFGLNLEAFFRLLDRQAGKNIQPFEQRETNLSDLPSARSLSTEGSASGQEQARQRRLASEREINQRRTQLDSRQKQLSQERRTLLEQRLSALRKGSQLKAATVVPPPTLIPLQPSGDRTPFFCVHPVSGLVNSYIDLARYLGQNQPFYGLQSPGLDGQTMPCDTIDKLAAYHLGAIKMLQPRGPYLLGGWSIGGLIAWEMARLLKQAGEQIQLLVLIDCYTLTRLHAFSIPEDRQLALALLKDLAGYAQADWPEQLAYLQQTDDTLSDDQWLAAVIDQVKAAGVVLPEIKLVQTQRLLDVFKANIRAFSQYIPPDYTGHVVLFESGSHREGTNETAAASWQAVLGHPVPTSTVPGDHYSMLKEPHVAVLAAQLRTLLESPPGL